MGTFHWALPRYATKRTHQEQQSQCKRFIGGLGRVKERKVISEWRRERRVDRQTEQRKRGVNRQTENREGGGQECRIQKTWMKELNPFAIWCETAPVWINFAVDTPRVIEDQV